MNKLTSKYKPLKLWLTSSQTVTLGQTAYINRLFFIFFYSELIKFKPCYLVPSEFRPKDPPGVHMSVFEHRETFSRQKYSVTLQKHHNLKKGTRSMIFLL